MAVIVVINPACAHGPRQPAQRSRTLQPRLFRYIGEGTVAVIPIELVAVHPGNEKILVAVTVVVSDCHPHAVAAPGKAGLFGHIAEGAVAVVAIQAVPVVPPRFFEGRQCRPIGAEQVRPSVAIEVDHAQSAGQRLHLVLASRRAVAEHKTQPRRGRAVDHPDRCCR